MELKHLRFFYEAAKLQHITAAAEQLMVSQPFLTKIIKQLEAELGVNLFDHIGRNIKLNAYGEAFFKHTEAILKELDFAQSEVREMAAYQSNTVTVITNTALYMPALQASVYAADLNINMVQSSGRRFKILKALEEGIVDYAFCSPAIIPDSNSDIESEIILKDGAYIIFSPNHPLDKEEDLRIEQLDGQNFYTSPLGFAIRDYTEVTFAKYGVKPNIVVETADTSAIIDYVNTGMGFAVIPMSIAVRNPHLLEKCKVLSGELGHVTVSWNRRVYKTEAQCHFLDIAREHFKKMQVIVDSYINMSM